MLFAGVIAVPAVGYRFLRWNAIFAFWFAYVVTRPLGASFADWMGKPRASAASAGATAAVALALAAAIVVLVAYLAVTKADVQSEHAAPANR